MCSKCTVLPCRASASQDHARLTPLEVCDLLRRWLRGHKAPDRSAGGSVCRLCQVLRHAFPHYIKVVRLRRLGEPVAVGPQAWHSPKSASLVPASPHLQGKQEPKSPRVVGVMTKRNSGICKQQQRKAFAKMPRRCRYLWWVVYRRMLRDKQDKLALNSMKADSSFTPF
jgi:hypothetical protein